MESGKPAHTNHAMNGELRANRFDCSRESAFDAGKQGDLSSGSNGATISDDSRQLDYPHFRVT
jgi:hypothetical protein